MKGKKKKLKDILSWQLLFLLPLYANALLFPLFIPRLPIKHTTLISLFYFSQEKEKRNSPSNYLIKHTFLFFFPQFNSLSKKVHNFTFHITFLEKHSPFMPLNLRQLFRQKTHCQQTCQGSYTETIVLQLV